MRAPTLVASFLFLAASCAAGDEQPAPATPTAAPAPEARPAAAAGLPIVTLARGTDTEYSAQAAEVVVRDASAWKALWEKANAGLVPPPALPKVDFSKDLVVAVFAGQKPTTGYAIEVALVERAGEGLLVTVREKKPAPDAMTGQALTYPFHIVSVPAAPGEVKFKRE